MTCSANLHSLKMQTIISARSKLKLQWQNHEGVVTLTNSERKASSSVSDFLMLRLFNSSHRSSRLLLGTLEVTHAMLFLRKRAIAT